MVHVIPNYATACEMLAQTAQTASDNTLAAIKIVDDAYARLVDARDVGPAEIKRLRSAYDAWQMHLEACWKVEDVALEALGDFLNISTTNANETH